MIDYRLNAELSIEQVIELFDASGLSRGRPRADLARMQTMLVCSNLTITAWQGGKLVGLARSVSDFAFATYLSDLAVHPTCQGQGIGRELLRCTQAAAPQATVVLIAAIGCESFYRHIGMRPHESAYLLYPGELVR